MSLEEAEQNDPVHYKNPPTGHLARFTYLLTGNHLRHAGDRFLLSISIRNCAGSLGFVIVGGGEVGWYRRQLTSRAVGGTAQPFKLRGPWTCSTGTVFVIAQTTSLARRTSRFVDDLQRENPHRKNTQVIKDTQLVPSATDHIGLEAPRSPASHQYVTSGQPNCRMPWAGSREILTEVGRRCLCNTRECPRSFAGPAEAEFAADPSRWEKVGLRPSLASVECYPPSS
ncbi:hypothetical protein J6590_005808 [Homalodisca vitripennis]|nr:hypothetical protein J6590_005808 [Homalodisca vitripennis]